MIVGSAELHSRTTPSVAKHAASRGGIQQISFTSEDIDETREHVARYGDHRRTIHGSAGFRYSEIGISTERVIIGRSDRTLGQTLSAAVSQPTLFVNLRGGDFVRYGRQNWEANERVATLSAPDQHYVRRGPGMATLAVRLDRELLERAIDQSETNRTRRKVLQSQAVPVDPSVSAEIAWFASAMQHVFSSGGDWGVWRDAFEFECSVAAWMCGMILGTGAVRSVSLRNVDRLVRLRHWIESNLSQDISIDLLAAVALTSPRSLQKTFLAVHGQTPLEYLAERRLLAAHRRLEQATDQLQVTAVAFDCGFRHLGRFSVRYREVFGESPSETVARANARRRDRLAP